ncbi:MAG: universal stress protein, partial [Steroidobacteraceae bacterium]
VEAVHAFFPAALLAAAAGAAGGPMVPDISLTDLLDTERQRMTAAIRALADAQGIPERQVRVLQGAAAELLPRLAETSHAAVLVMGGIARGRLKEAIIGSTAERVLDRLSCDVLVVKPADFGELLPF